mmetsp:Transcript_8708/g.8242  ORF Transcript_8708/g.8242 Transcript_8708/m.8242 type:complete len:143 (-) Transcript_8708:2-430(-)
MIMQRRPKIGIYQNSLKRARTPQRLLSPVRISSTPLLSQVLAGKRKGSTGIGVLSLIRKDLIKDLNKMEIKHKNIRKSLRRSMNKNKGKFKKQSVITGEKWMLKFIEIPKFNTMQRNTLMEKTSEEIRQIIRQRKKESVLML